MTDLKKSIKQTPVLGRIAGAFNRPAPAAPAPSQPAQDDKVWRQKLAAEREQDLHRIPRRSLNEANVAGCEMLLNRTELLKRLPAHGVVAELGVDQGDFSETILGVTGARKLHLVDVWGTTRYGTDKFQQVQDRFADRIAGGQVSITRKLSTDAASEFEDKYFDWIYIDTDHTYETTRDELRLWHSKVKDGGYIAGHDYVMGNWRKGYKYGVIEAVAEFCVEYGWRLTYVTADFTESNSFAITRI